MQTLAEFCIRRPVAAMMLILGLTVIGMVSYFRLGVDRFPSVDLPVVRISTTLPGASPEEVERQISDRIESVVNTVEGIEELRSVSGAGQSFVVATFRLDRDIDAAAQDVRDRVAAAVRDLPRGADPPVVSKSDNESTPVLSIAVVGSLNQRQLTTLADRVVKRQVERSKGVGEVQLTGGLERTINVWLHADRLAAYQLPATAVRDAVIRQNADLPGGNVTTPDREQSLRTIGRIPTPAEFNEIVITTRDGAPIYLRDVGYAEDGAAEQRTRALLNGVPTVLLEVRRQSGANTIEVIDAVRANLDRIAAQLPPGVRLEPIADQSRYIKSALHEINLHLVAGSILASLVVLLFMRDWRSTLIAAIAIPTSVISTFGVMLALGFTLNSVTMLGLVLMVGIVIDDAIVVLENIFRFIEEKGMSARDAAREATREIGPAVMATTFSLVVIFVPVSFMSGITGRFLFQFGITAAAAVLVSLLVSFTLTPMMSARMLRIGAPSGPHGRKVGWLNRVLDAVYERLLRIALRWKLAVLIAVAGVMYLSVPLYEKVRQEYVPTNVDEAEFEVNVTAAEGVGFDFMHELMTRVDQVIRAVPGVELNLVTTGGGFLNSVNQGRCYVRIEPHEARTFSFRRAWNGLLAGDPLAAFRGNYSQREVMQTIRNELRKIPGIRSSVRNRQSFNIGGGSWDVDFALRGPELRSLLAYATELTARALRIGGFTDLDTTLRLDRPELRVRIDRDRAADLGVRVEDIASTLRLMVGGDNKVSRYRDDADNEEYDIRLRLIQPDRASARDMERLYLPSEGGRLVRLDSLASIEPSLSASRIDRLDRQRQVSVRGGIAQGYALADRIEVLREQAADLNLPPGYTTMVAGRGRELARTYGEFALAFLLSVVFMYMILAAQFESLIHPLTILLSLPLALPFALFSLWVTSDTLNMYSALGVLVLFGIVKKNSILQIDHAIQLRAAGMDRVTAIVQGSRDRLRPILMTTLSFVAGMLPLAIGTGPGAEERRTIAIVIIGGQTLSLLLTLIATPVVYILMEDLADLFRRGRPRTIGQPDARSAAHVP